MKKIAIIFGVMSLIVACNSNTKTQTTEETPETVTAPVKAQPQVKAQVNQLDEVQYKSTIFDFEKSPQQWVFNGRRPCVVDFYADWCRPCKMIAPFFDTLAIEYAGKVDFYKVNVDEARNLSQFFNIQSIPFVMFCDKQVAQFANGAYPIDFYRSMIDSLLLQ